ncbi:DoxX family protein [Nocardia rhizosphaerae]|uniref:DoxX family protein n=1 Tax=Nocardia rhizosphaerae TaxID=1691571 RepID=A0ABV8L776_9NOCA
MATATVERTDDDRADPAPPAPWHPLTRLAFRFTVAYLGLFCLWMAQITFVFTGVLAPLLPPEAVAWQIGALGPVSGWVGTHILGVDAELRMNGSGDQAAIWIQCGLVLTLAIAVTVIWSVLDRRRRAYPRAASWFLTALRLCVGGQLLFYGFVKLIPTQMPEPALTTLLTQVGDLSPMAMLWNQVGSAPAYEMALGLAEVLAGLLLFWPRTATLGAMLGVISMAQVFLLNLTFGVPVKMLSGHLLLMSLVLLVPQARRLLNFLVLERTAEPARQPALFASARANRRAAMVQVGLGLWIAAGCVLIAVQNWRDYGGGVAKPELYGIWEVTEYTVDGDPLPPLRTDEVRWQRLIIDTGSAAYQRMDDTLVPVAADTDPAAPTLSLTVPGGEPEAAPAPYAVLVVERPAPDRLVLRGEVDGTATTVTMTRTDLDGFALRGTGFRWVQNTPYLG